MLGGEAKTEINVTQEARSIIEDYPAAANDPPLFNWIFLKKQCPWLAQLEENRKMELKAALRGLERLRRARQEVKNSLGIQ